MDAIHYKVREEKHVVVKAAYIVIGVNLDGEVEVSYQNHIRHSRNGAR
jgi:putative transposase